MAVSERRRLAILCDFREERWHSMDLAAEMLRTANQQRTDRTVDSELVRPEFRRRVGRRSAESAGRESNADRLFNRFVDYHRHLRPRIETFDLFHVADHSYAHLVHGLPAASTGVFCHDLDTFRCLLAPATEPRPLWFRAMARRVLTGMQRAAVVFYSTDAVRARIEAHKLVPASRLVQAPYGVAEEYTPEPLEDHDRSAIADALTAPYVLHVGSTIPRKRIDVLLDVFGHFAAAHPKFRLVHAGGTFTDEQKAQMRSLRISNAVVDLPRLSRADIAELYRHAEIVLLPSEEEGFGLPVIEALACGARVVASDIPVLREVGGDVVDYAGVGDVEAWVATIARVLARPADRSARSRRIARASRYSWARHAEVVIGTYEALSSEVVARNT